jgi:hypothetical protein
MGTNVLARQDRLGTSESRRNSPMKLEQVQQAACLVQKLSLVRFMRKELEKPSNTFSEFRFLGRTLTLTKEETAAFLSEREYSILAALSMLGVHAEQEEKQ